MKYLLDTNVCIAHLRGTNANVTNQLAAVAPGDAVLSSVVKAELWFGAERSANRSTNQAQLSSFFAAIPSLPFDDSASEVYGRIRAELEAQGTPIGPNDLMIAATALSSGLILVTHNTSEFARVSGLQIEDWQTT
ncbi:MAG: type II toxin-antitoxin system VapC family toxin [Planctomycetota bacterium]|nr:type II toxin-antitoxin system VapC family toxin [Planctomycetota bacterium]